MRVGVNLAPADYAARLPRWPGATLCRVFAAEGHGIPAWTDPRITTLVAAGITPHLSFKDWASDADAVRAVTTALDTMPTPLPRVWLTYHHEPEGDLNSAVYRHRWFVLADTIARHPSGRRVWLVPIQTLQWTTATGPGKGNGDPSLYHAGFGWPGMDCYAASWRPTYPDPAQFLAPALRLADACGAPLVVPELGAVRVPADVTGQQRADWIRAVAAVLREEGCAAVSWWDAPGAHNLDFRLDDAPSYQAWRDVLALAGG